MNLEAAIEARLPYLRQQAESMMRLTLTPYVPGTPDQDDHGHELLTWVAQEQHPGKVQGGSQAGKDAPTRYVTVGGVERPVLTAGLHIPIGAPVPVANEQRGIGWEYEVAAVGPLDDPALLGRRFLVVAAPAKSKATARRLDVVEVEPPALATIVKYHFDTDGDTEGWAPAVSDDVTAAGGVLIVTAAGGGGVYVESSAPTGASVSVAADIAGDAGQGDVVIQVDDRVAALASDFTTASGIGSFERLTIGPIVLTAPQYRVSVGSAATDGEQIAVDNVTITITEG